MSLNNSHCLNILPSSQLEEETHGDLSRKFPSSYIPQMLSLKGGNFCHTTVLANGGGGVVEGLEQATNSSNW